MAMRGELNGFALEQRFSSMVAKVGKRDRESMVVQLGGVQVKKIEALSVTLSSVRIA